MMDRKPRRFGMGDLMIFIAALALGAAGTRLVIWPGGENIRQGMPGGWSMTAAWYVMPILVGVWLVPLTVGFVAVRLRQPRPRRARLVIQPGMAAACAIGAVCAFWVAGLTVRLVGGLLYAAGFDWSTLEFMFPLELSGLLDQTIYNYFLADNGGLAVAAVWLVLWLSGRWRAERSWIDRLGRSLGICWIALAALAVMPS